MKKSGSLPMTSCASASHAPTQKLLWRHVRGPLTLRRRRDFTVIWRKPSCWRRNMMKVCVCFSFFLFFIWFLTFSRIFVILFQYLIYDFLLFLLLYLFISILLYVYIYTFYSLVLDILLCFGGKVCQFMLDILLSYIPI